MEVGGEEDYIPIATLSPPELLYFCIKMGSNESHFNVLSRLSTDHNL